MRAACTAPHNLLFEEMAEEYKLDNTVKAVLPSTNAASINGIDTSDLIPEKEINSTYRKLLGQLLHLSVHTRPDISTVTSYLGQFAAKPTVDKYKCLIRCLQYVINTKDRCIRLKPEHTKLMGYSDASYNSNKMDSRSQQDGLSLLTRWTLAPKRDTYLHLVNMDMYLPIQANRNVFLLQHVRLN